MRAYGGSTIVSATPSEVESWRSETNLIRTPRLEWREGYPFVGFRCVLRLPSVLKLGDSPIRDDAVLGEGVGRDAEAAYGAGFAPQTIPLLQDEPTIPGGELDSEDRGTVRFFEGRPYDLVIESESTPTAIFDWARMSDTLDVPINDRRRIREVHVYVRLRHPDQDQLRMTVSHPSGSTVSLQGQLTSAGESLSRIYGLGTGDDLGAFDGLAVGGEWRLRIEDTTPGLQGTLENWVLLVRF